MAAVAVDKAERDRRLTALIVEKGLAKEADVEECLAIRAKLVAAGAQKSLADVMKEKKLVDEKGAEEVARLAAEVKAAAKKALERAARSAQAAARTETGDIDPAKLKIPGYEIIELLGKGGMGSVFKARQRSLDRIVALKVLSPDVARDETYLRRFTTEARALARLNHENIIAGIDVGEANGFRYFAMEYVEGASLAALIERDGALPEKRALTIAMQIARALVHADKSSLVHRDVKPQNIMVGRNDVAKLCDLGLAMTAEERKEARERGQSIGTPHYISPEQARGEHRVDIRSDIYSLGATLYHTVTGETPFSGTSPMVLMTKHLTEEPVPPRKRNTRVSRALNDLILKMMAKEKEKRYQTPIELLEDMERVLAGRPIDGGTSGRSKKAEEKVVAQVGSRGPHKGRSAGGRARLPQRAKRPGVRPPADEGFEGEEGEEPEEERPYRPKKSSPAVPALIALFVILIGGGIAVAIFLSQQNQPAEAPRPAEEPWQRNATESLVNITTMYNRGEIDKFYASDKLTELVGKFPNTRAAEQAKEFIEKLKSAPIQKDEGTPSAGAEEAADTAPAKRPPPRELSQEERDRLEAEEAGGHAKPAEKKPSEAAPSTKGDGVK